MKILFIGDIVGRLGRQVVTEWLPAYKRDKKIDWVVANGENLAGGRGLNKKTVREISAVGVDVITAGNHVWRDHEAVEILKNKKENVIRPANYPPGTPGQGWRLFTNHLGQRLLVINLIGRTYMRENFDCPFQAVDRILAEEIGGEGIVSSSLDAVVVDFHAEVGSEKKALGYYLDGRVTAVVGTHTHIPTADEQLLPNGTAYVTDLGMAGAYDSVLGVDKDIIIKQFLSARPQRFVWKTTGTRILTGVIVSTKKGSLTAVSIKRLVVKFD